MDITKEQANKLILNVSEIKEYIELLNEEREKRMEYVQEGIDIISDIKNSIKQYIDNVKNISKEQEKNVKESNILLEKIYLESKKRNIDAKSESNKTTELFGKLNNNVTKMNQSLSGRDSSGLVNERLVNENRNFERFSKRMEGILKERGNYRNDRITITQEKEEKEGGMGILGKILAVGASFVALSTLWGWLKNNPEYLKAIGDFFKNMKDRFMTDVWPHITKAWDKFSPKLDKFWKEELKPKLKEAVDGFWENFKTGAWDVLKVVGGAFIAWKVLAFTLSALFIKLPMLLIGKTMGLLGSGLLKVGTFLGPKMGTLIAAGAAPLMVAALGAAAIVMAKKFTDAAVDFEKKRAEAIGDSFNVSRGLSKKELEHAEKQGYSKNILEQEKRIIEQRRLINAQDAAITIEEGRGFLKDEKMIEQLQRQRAQLVQGLNKLTKEQEEKVKHENFLKLQKEMGYNFVNRSEALQKLQNDDSLSDKEKNRLKTLLRETKKAEKEGGRWKVRSETPEDFIKPSKDKFDVNTLAKETNKEDPQLANIENVLKELKESMDTNTQVNLEGHMVNAQATAQSVPPPPPTPVAPPNINPNTTRNRANIYTHGAYPLS